MPRTAIEIEAEINALRRDYRIFENHVLNKTLEI